MRGAAPVAAALAGLLPGAAVAQSAAPPLPGGTGALAQLALSLAVVVALIVALAWLARRLRIAPAGGEGALRVLAQLPVGPRERVLLLAVGDRQALVGVSSAGVTSLALLDARVEAVARPAAPAGEPPLAERVRAMLDRGGRA